METRNIYTVKKWIRLLESFLVSNEESFCNVNSDEIDREDDHSKHCDGNSDDTDSENSHSYVCHINCENNHDKNYNGNIAEIDSEDDFQKQNNSDEIDWQQRHAKHYNGYSENGNNTRKTEEEKKNLSLRGKKFFELFGVTQEEYNEDDFKFGEDDDDRVKSVTKLRTYVWPKFSELGKWKSTAKLHKVIARVKDDKFSGPGEMFYCDGTTAKTVFRNGLPSGYSIRYFGKALIWAGNVVGGGATGECVAREWEGGGILYGEVDIEGEHTGEYIFLYPDMTTALVGRFENTVMVAAKPAQVRKMWISRGSLRLEYDLLSNSVITFSPATNTSMGDQPNTRDPYEEDLVEARSSNMEGGGEGVFARQKLLPNTILAMFNGTRHCLLTNLAAGLENDDDIYSRLSYNIHMPENEDYFLDIPPKFRDLSAYSASLGHKVNHSFYPNCEFSTIFHPRWGRIRCVKSTKTILQDEELFVNYGYDLYRSPDWYKLLWEKENT